MTNRDVAAMPVKDVQQLVHELQVHQIELEMQNDELRRAQMELEVARDRYVNLYDFSPAGYLTLDIQGMIQEANLRAGTLLGLNRQDLIGQPLARFCVSDDRDILHRHRQAVLTSGTRQTCELRLGSGAVASCDLYLESLAVHEEPGRITHWRTALLDISDRKRAEEGLETQRVQLEAIIGSAMDGIITVDGGGRVVFFNRAAESMFLCQAAATIGQPLDQFIPERFRQAHHGHVRAFALTQMTSRSMGRPGMLFGLRANGEEFPIEASISHVRVSDKNLLTVILRDVTERKQAEQEQARLIQDLTRSQQHFQSLFNWIPSAVGISTVAEGRFCDVNEGFSRLTGYTREEVIGRTTLELGLWADPSERAIVLREIREQGYVHNREGLLRTKSGEIRSLMVSVESIQLGSTSCLIYLGHDITERKRAEAALRLAKFSVDRAADAVYWIDPQAKILDVNEAASLMMGYSKDELCALTVHDLSPDFQADRWPGFWAETQQRGTMVIETVHRAKNGRLIPVEVSVNYLSYEGKEYHCAFVRDITERKRAETELCESDARLRAILDNSPGMVFLKDTEGRYLHVNCQFERAFHMTREQVVGKTDEAIFVPEQAAAFRANDLKALQAGVPLEFEEVAMHDDGPHTSIVSKFPLFGGDGKPYALCGITTDITWRKIAEKALQASDVFTRAVLDSLSAHICVLSKDGTILKTNDAWKEFAQQHVGNVFTLGKVGDNFLDCCRLIIAGDASTSQAMLKGVEAVLRGDQPSFSAEYQTLLPEVPHWFLMRVTPLKESNGVVISHTDISGQVLMGLALEQQVLLLSDKQKELESLTGKLIDAQEQECRRIARELHDDFNQRLAALAVELETLERTPDAFPEPVVQQLTAVRDHVGQLSDDLHDLAYRLHPSLLEHVGLEVAARDHVTEFTKRTGLPVTLTAREVPGTLSPEVATNLFRVMQESLQNVLKHARATEVTVKLSGSSKGIGLSVRDNGQGFDLECTGVRVQGLGLVSMQERMRLMGGFLRIHSLPTDGTKVCAWIPRAQEGA
jgi:PAS domain S-box-containing protein